MSIHQRPGGQEPPAATPEPAPAIAPDGQRIVRQQDTRADEQADIDRAAAGLEAGSRRERAEEPSARFWSSRRAQLGPILALLAGLATLAFHFWPIAVPQGRGAIGMSWYSAVTIIAFGYIGAFFLADRRWQLARIVLVIGAILHLAVGVVSGLAVDAEQLAPGPLAALFDVGPALVALVAAFLIVPPPATLHDRR